ncbi:MAG: hypothetical protein MJE77_19835 [Proteobacteria bacterium]|nr:hypothetical protein [Pseudomonadota bacterium]
MPNRSGSEKTLWFAFDGQGYYLIPDDAELPDGPLALRTVLGRERAVDANAVQEFRAAEEEIAEHIKHAAEKRLAAIKDTVSGVLSGLSQAWAQASDQIAPDAEIDDSADPGRFEGEREVASDAESSSASAASARTSGQPDRPGRSSRRSSSGQAGASSRATALWAALTGQNAQEIASDPESIKRGAQTIAGEFIQLVRDVTEAGDLGLARAKQRLRGLGERLRQFGYTGSIDLDGVAERLQAMVGSGPTGQEMRASAERMERAAEAVTEIAARLAESLRERAEHLRQAAVKDPDNPPHRPDH